jgi:hypothetical protein
MASILPRHFATNMYHESFWRGDDTTIPSFQQLQLENSKAWSRHKSKEGNTGEESSAKGEQEGQKGGICQ